MKKWISLFLLLLLAAGFAGCEEADACRISFTIPAGSAGEFIYSAEEISATGNKITISSNDRLGDAMVILHPVKDTVTAGYVATGITPDTPATFDADAGVWFKIGLSVKNESDTDQTVYVTVSGADVRIQ